MSFSKYLKITAIESFIGRLKPKPHTPLHLQSPYILKIPKGQDSGFSELNLDFSGWNTKKKTLNPNISL